jgi:HSP20 family protein
MPRLILWKDEQMGKLRRDMDRLYHRVYGEFGIPLISTTLRGAPIMDLSETEDNLIVRTKISNIDPKDLDISVTRDTLRINARSRKDRVDETGGYRYTRRQRGSYSRTLQLPCRVEVDDVKATYSKEGLLSIVMPKCKPEKARKIEVDVT